MSSVYIKGTRVWLPDATAGWVPGTVTSVFLPSDQEPTSQVSITVAFDEPNDAGSSPKEYKCSLATLQAASDSNGNSISPAAPPPGEDALPPLRNPPLLESSEDLASLSNLNEPSGMCKHLAHEWWSNVPQYYTQLPPAMALINRTRTRASSLSVQRSIIMLMSGRVESVQPCAAL